MRRAVLTAAVLLAVLPEAAAAAPFGELPFRPAGGTATCLRATGYPGEVVRSTDTGAEFLQATAAGLVPVAAVTSASHRYACPIAVARPNGAGAVVFTTYEESRSGVAVQVALREPGGAWSTPAEVARVEQFAEKNALAADVSERGDTLVAFVGGEPKKWAIRAARRAPGGAFAPAETVFALGKAPLNLRVAAGVSAGGESVVAWAFQPATGKPRELWASIAPAGGPFATPVKLGTVRSGSPFTLAVGAGGDAVLAFPNGDGMFVAERPPGAGFGAAARVGAANDRLAVFPAAAVGADGGAVVAWQNTFAGTLEGVIRAQPGAFGAPLSLVPESGLKFPKVVLDLFDAFLTDDTGEFFSDSAGPDDQGGLPRALITPDGRALVTAAGVAKRDGIWGAGPQWATVPLSGGAVETQVLGAGLRDAGAIAPLVTADGTAGIAWADNNDDERDGRLHLALEGSPDGTDPPPPSVRVLGPTRRVLAADADLPLTIRCSAACDVRVQLGKGPLAPGETVSLTRAGDKRIRLFGFYTPLATLTGGPVDLSLNYGAPGTRRATAKTVTLHLRRLPDAPVPRALGVIARREGQKIVVTWRSDRGAKPSNFLVYGTPTRKDPTDPLVSVLADGNATGSGRQFSIRLSDPRKTAHYVQIVSRAKGARKTRTTTVRVRG
ncbi:hypothetical protein OM076_14190 [Solirubrobacter ginsenosidimutans]|uniref:Fibronectin type-III domain-containing protein n=1 Tax=Solirubrobacter ginsenosidimutans TaxID=490573 RepID=A0A9X3MXX0_9ACTN|nr:hypothetical protein [Solirubrobacter ginsenosidimutans]MDA0161423.1 hypothetical protein [Solirubrobacter ginsenosidimutans]